MREYAQSYDVQIEWDPVDRIYIAWATEMPLARTHGETRREALSNLDEVLDQSIALLVEKGRPVPEPIATRDYSGRFSVRVTRSLHRELALRAAREGASLGALVREGLRSFLAAPKTSAARRD